MASFGAPEAFNYLVGQGYSPVQAAALAGNIQQESGFNPANVNQKEGAEGLVQWRQGRLDNLKNFAASTGRAYTDPTAQLDFIGQEMSGPEAKSGSAFMKATDLSSANAALKNYIRYGDNSQNTRLQYAGSILGGAPQANGPTPMAPQNNAPAPVAQQSPVPSYNQPPQQQANLPAYGWSPGQAGSPQVASQQAQAAPLPAMKLSPQLLALLHPSLRSMLS